MVQQALHNPPTGGVMPEEWQSLGKSFRARSDPGNPPLPKMSYDPGELLHSPWSMDALSRSGLGLPAESQVRLASLLLLLRQAQVAVSG